MKERFIPQGDGSNGFKRNVDLSRLAPTELPATKRPEKVRLKIKATLERRWKDEEFRKKRTRRKHSRQRKDNIARGVEKKWRDDPIYRQRGEENLRRINSDPKELERRRKKRKKLGKKARKNISRARRRYIKQIRSQNKSTEVEIDVKTSEETSLPDDYVLARKKAQLARLIKDRGILNKDEMVLLTSALK